MALTKLTLKSTQPFDFSSTIESHGWVELLPNVYYSQDSSFFRIEQLPSGKVVGLAVSAGKRVADGSVAIEVHHKGKLARADTECIQERVSHMLRLDEDFGTFYALCEKKGRPWSNMANGKGRLLCSPGMFEEIVKVICTTNIQWGGTKRMVKEIVAAFGSPFPLDPEMKAFPSPEAIAAVPFEEFENKVRLGYRTAYVHALAVEMANDPSPIHALQDQSMDTGEIRKRLLAIKGIGSYAAASLLMLLGRYEYIPVDTVFRQLMSDKYFKEGEFELAEALALYDDWGEWKYLAYWFDLLDFYHPT